MGIDILLWLQAVREAAGPAVEAIVNIVSSLPLSPITYAVPFFLYWCYDKRAGCFTIISFGVATSLLNIIKVFACVPRPWILDSRVEPSQAALGSATGYSFPSGHVQTTGSIYGGAGWYYRAHRWPLVVGIVLTLIIAFTRCYLGVHTPQDVVAGMLVAVVGICAAERIMKLIEEECVDARVVLAICLAIVAILTVVTALKPYPEVEGVDPYEMILDGYKAFGLSGGVAVGLFCERRYVGFSTDGTLREKTIRVVVSLAVAALVYLACQPIKMAGLDEAYYFSRSFFCVIAALWAGPAVARFLAAKFPGKRKG